MNHLKLIVTLFISVLTISIASAQDSTRNTQAFTPVEQVPEFPGGLQAFYKYIASTLKYPEVAKIVGLTGKVYVTFIVDKDGSITHVKPIKCLGAGCESEAVRILSMSPKWVPGVQKGQPVRVQYTMPISFNLDYGDSKITTQMRHLRNSDYVFVFYIKGKAYTVDEAEKILGKSFDPNLIASVENYDHPEYNIPDKKGVYLIVMKDI